MKTRARLLMLVAGCLIPTLGLPAADKDAAAKADKRPDLSGQIVEVSNEPRSITVEIPPKVKGDDPTSVKIRFDDKTKFTYFGVDAAGESPTVGYVILVWLVEGSQDSAASIRLGRKDADGGQKGSDLSGQIVEVSRDGKTLIVEIAPEEKGGQPTKAQVKLTDKTKFSYFGVDATGETPTVGYSVLVWLVKGSKDTASGLRLGLKD
jgi:hypothetical protein